MVFGLGRYMNGVGSSRFGLHTPFIFFEVAPFPRVQRWQEPFVRVEDTKVESIKLTFLGQLFKINYVVSKRFIKISKVNITNTL